VRCGCYRVPRDEALDGKGQAKMSYNTHTLFRSIYCPGVIILTTGAAVVLTALPYHYGSRPLFQPVQITLSGMAFLHGLYLYEL